MKQIDYIDAWVAGKKVPSKCGNLAVSPRKPVPDPEYKPSQDTLRWHGVRRRRHRTRTPSCYVVASRFVEDRIVLWVAHPHMPWRPAEAYKRWTIDACRTHGYDFVVPMLVPGVPERIRAIPGYHAGRGADPARGGIILRVVHRPDAPAISALWEMFHGHLDWEAGQYPPSYAWNDPHPYHVDKWKNYVHLRDAFNKVLSRLGSPTIPVLDGPRETIAYHETRMAVLSL